MLTGIAGRDRITHDEKNIVILNRAEEYILKNTITKFIFGLKDPDLWLHMIEYRTKPTCSFYGAFKKIEVYIDILNTKVQMQKKLDLKSGYEAFKFFYASVTYKQNTQPCSYKTFLCKAQSYQPSLPYLEGKQA